MLGGLAVVSNNLVQATIPGAVIYTPHSLVDGTFLASVTFDVQVDDFEIADIIPTNATCEKAYTNDDLIWFIWVTPDGVGDVGLALDPTVGTATPITVTVSPQWQYLLGCNWWFFFRDLNNDDNQAVRPEDPGLNDLAGNVTLTAAVGSPRVRNNVEGGNGVAGLQCNNARAYSLPSATAQTAFTTSFHAAFLMSFADGRPSGTIYLTGANDAANNGFKFHVATTGRLEFTYAGSLWRSTAQEMTNGANDPCVISVTYDFSTDTLTVNMLRIVSAVLTYQTIAGSFISGSMTNLESTYACTADLFLGNNNNNGAVQSSSEQSSIYHFSVGSIPSDPEALARYIYARRPTIEFISTLVNDALKYPHAIKVYDRLATSGAVVGKGDPELSTGDGSLANLGISDPTTMTIIDSYYDNADLPDAETVHYPDGYPNRVLIFFEDGVYLFAIDGSGQLTKLDTVVTVGHVVNGGAQIGHYYFGFDKGSRIQVIDLSGVTGSPTDTISLFGTKVLTGDGILSAHDGAKLSDNRHICGVDIDGGHDFFIYQVFDDNGILPLVDWVLKGVVDSATLLGANRVQYIKDDIVTIHGNNLNYCASIDASDVDNPVLLDLYSQINKSSSGACNYRDKYVISGGNTTLFLYSIINATNQVIPVAGYSNNVDFATGPSGSHHDMEWVIKDYEIYIPTPYQNEKRMTMFRANRI